MTDGALVVLLGVGLGGVVCGSVAFGILLIRWARKNRARAAAMMTGTYLEQDDVAGAPLDPNDEDVLDRFSDWLGEKIDSLSDSSGATHDHSDAGTDASSHDGGGHHDSGGDCGGGDSGGVCD